MKPDQVSGQVRADWVNRQKEHGNGPRAVLMKGLHASINELIDTWHRRLMQAAFAGPGGTPNPTLDVGCGYGRLADEATRCGLGPVVGMDFATGFCVDFMRNHGPAVCGDISRLPFRDEAFSNAYSVTSLMYLPFEQARHAVLEIDRCLADNARVLLVEPSREFNSLVRIFLRRKRAENLAMPGFSRDEFARRLAPGNWRHEASGNCSAMTALLPLLMATAPVRPLFRLLARVTLMVDSPAPGKKRAPARFSMYRWAVYRKSRTIIQSEDSR